MQALKALAILEQVQASQHAENLARGAVVLLYCCIFRSKRPRAHQALEWELIFQHLTQRGKKLSPDFSRERRFRELEQIDLRVRPRFDRLGPKLLAEAEGSPEGLRPRGVSRFGIIGFAPFRGAVALQGSAASLRPSESKSPKLRMKVRLGSRGTKPQGRSARSVHRELLESGLDDYDKKREENAMHSPLAPLYDPLDRRHLHDCSGFQSHHSRMQDRRQSDCILDCLAADPFRNQSSFMRPDAHSATMGRGNCQTP